MNERAGQPITAEEQEVLLNLMMTVEQMLRHIAEEHGDVFGNALQSLATYTVEKVYLCSPDMKTAGEMLSFAQEQGLQNWIDNVEAAEAGGSEPDSPIILDS